MVHCTALVRRWRALKTCDVQACLTQCCDLHKCHAHDLYPFHSDKKSSAVYFRSNLSRCTSAHEQLISPCYQTFRLGGDSLTLVPRTSPCRHVETVSLRFHSLVPNAIVRHACIMATHTRIKKRPERRAFVTQALFDCTMVSTQTASACNYIAEKSTNTL